MDDAERNRDFFLVRCGAGANAHALILKLPRDVDAAFCRRTSTSGPRDEPLKKAHQAPNRHSTRHTTDLLSPARDREAENASQQEREQQPTEESAHSHN